MIDYQTLYENYENYALLRYMYLYSMMFVSDLCEFPSCLQAENRENGALAALKQVEIKAEDDLEDFLVEIDILTKCKHKNVVGLHETYFYGGKLWVCIY